mmetsp:Transcript_26635/g.61712  ORF Transcript_26635/g.61712 Transcript_26635/m.61712 type:complete len:271 (+) Transcript_26635:63-875(+)
MLVSRGRAVHRALQPVSPIRLYDMYSCIRLTVAVRAPAIAADPLGPRLFSYRYNLSRLVSALRPSHKATAPCSPTRLQPSPSSWSLVRCLSAGASAPHPSGPRKFRVRSRVSMKPFPTRSFPSTTPSIGPIFLKYRSTSLRDPSLSRDTDSPHMVSRWFPSSSAAISASPSFAVRPSPRKSSPLNCFEAEKASIRCSTASAPKYPLSEMSSCVSEELALRASHSRPASAAPKSAALRSSTTTWLLSMPSRGMSLNDWICIFLSPSALRNK